MGVVAASVPVIDEYNNLVRFSPHPHYFKFKVVCVYMVLLMLLASHANATTSSIVKFLPGFPGPLPFKLETGYIGVDEKEDVQFFYYFLESEGNPREDPLVLWLSGGPGCSALTGLVFQIGPLLFNMVEYNGSLPTLVLNPHSWTKVSSVIFLDAPVGTGFSYSRSMQGSETGDIIFARQSYSFLRKWLISHPEFIRNPLYIAGDSYAGKIVPIIVGEISDGIEAKHEPSINIKGYLVGNPVTDPNFDYNSRISFAYHMALISEELYTLTKRTCKGEYFKVDQSNKQCVRNLQAVLECTRQINNFHILEPKCDSELAIREENQRRLLENHADSLLLNLQLPNFGCRDYNSVLCTIWANDHSVQQALNVRKETVKVWIRCKKDLPYRKDVSSVVNYHLNLHTRGYRALIYSGDHDMTIPYVGTQWWIKSLNFSIVDGWRPWLVDNQVAGYLQEYSNDFTFSTIKGGGHAAAEYQPKECFAMFNRWISKRSL